MEEKGKFIDGLAERSKNTGLQRRKPIPMSEMEVGVRRSASTSSRRAIRANVKGSSAGHEYSRSFVSSRRSTAESGWSNPKSIVDPQMEVGYRSTRRERAARDIIEMEEEDEEVSSTSFIDKLYSDTKNRVKKRREEAIMRRATGDPLANKAVSERSNISRNTFGATTTRADLQGRVVGESSRMIGVAGEKKLGDAGRIKNATPKRTIGFTEKNFKAKNTGFFEDEFDDEFDDEEIGVRKRVSKKAVEKKENKKFKKLYGKNGKKKSFILRHKIAVLFVVLFIALTGAVYFWGDSIISKITGGRSGLLDVIRTAISSNKQLPRDKYNRTNILIFGTSGYDMNGTDGDHEHDGAQLTDSIMILSVNEAGKDAAMINVPRDFYIETCANNKINEVFWCANLDNKNEQAGAEALTRKISDIFGLQIHYYVHVNWVTLISIVNALGGITVTLDETIDDDMTNTHIAAGQPVTLNGEKALGLARARYGTEGGDFTRANSQQKILESIKQKIAENGLDLIQIMQIATSLGDNLRTNAAIEDMAAGARAMSTLPLNALHPLDLSMSGAGLFTTADINRVSYVIPTAGQTNYDSIRSFLSQQFSLNATKRESANILVLNGSGIEGLAAKEQAELQAAGFTVGGIDNAPASPTGGYFDKLYLYKTGSGSAKPNTLDRLEKYYSMSAMPADQIPAGVNQNGYDFIVILGVGYTEEL